MFVGLRQITTNLCFQVQSNLPISMAFLGCFYMWQLTIHYPPSIPWGFSSGGPLAHDVLAKVEVPADQQLVDLQSRRIVAAVIKLRYQ